MSEGDLSKLTPEQKGDLMDKVKTQVLVANMQDLLQKITEKCYIKCVPKPGSSLDSSEKKCLGLCMDRYMDAQNLVAKTYAGRVTREQQLR